MSLIRLTDVWKFYDARPALRGVSLEIREGLRLAIMGPNGAGKTTLLRIISGLLRPDRGSVEVLGADPFADPEVRRQLVLITSEMGHFPRMRLEEFLDWIGEVYGLSSSVRRTRITDALRKLELEDLRREWLSRLSSGNQQRAHLARVLVIQPRVLVMDEPTARLDFRTTVSFLNFLIHEIPRDTVLLFSTHQLWEARLLGQELAILHDGQLLARGTEQAILEKFGVSTLEEVLLQKSLPS